MTETAIIAIAIGLAVFLVAYFSGIEVAFNTANRLNIELKKSRAEAAAFFYPIFSIILHALLAYTQLVSLFFLSSLFYWAPLFSIS